jgi:Cu(I)/Ag(I) efflux system membrane fusion protein
MKTRAVAGLATLAILALACVADWFGPAAAEQSDHKHDAAPAKPARPVLYYRHPENAADFSATAKKTADGRDYVAVYDDQEADFKEATAARQKAEKNKGRKLLYYRNPMGLPDTSPVPKKDWMGMDYIPIYEGEEEAGATVKISLDRVQRAGVRTEKAEKRVIERHVRAPGIAKPDERKLRIVSLRSDGFVEKLYVNETGRHVKAGEPLFRVYSPQVVSAQVDFRTNTLAGGRGPRDELSAVQRLKNLDVPQAVIEQLKAGSGPILSFDWPAPVSGYVMEKNVTEGQMAKAGEPLFRLAGLDPIWIVADVPEQDVALVKEGSQVNVGFRAFPDRLFKGRVTFILHELDPRTRTAKVRIEVGNADHAIRHEMFADVEIVAAEAHEARLTVPASAVIDTGARRVVLVDRGEGRFEPRNVTLGTRGDGVVEVKDGVKEDESVVVSANFLIDAESNIRAALKAFTADSPSSPADPGAAEQQPAATPPPAPTQKGDGRKGAKQ